MIKLHVLLIIDCIGDVTRADKMEALSPSRVWRLCSVADTSKSQIKVRYDKVVLSWVICLLQLFCTPQVYRVVGKEPIHIKGKPSAESEGIVGTLQPGEEVVISQVLSRSKDEDNEPYGQTYLKLGDGRGWICTFSPGSDDRLVVQHCVP